MLRTNATKKPDIIQYAKRGTGDILYIFLIYSGKPLMTPTAMDKNNMIKISFKISPL
jgi:hypothetical protein